jgi:hypothetical protein
MIVARMVGKDSPSDSPGNTLLFLLEPGNIAKLQMGHSIVKKLHEFMPDKFAEDAEIIIALCPDIGYVAERVKAGDDFLDAVEKAMKRPEVYLRQEATEDLTKFLGEAK